MTPTTETLREKSWLWFMRKPIFKETKEGGRYTRRTPVPGEKVGESKVLRQFKQDERGNTVWLVQCPCGKEQYRTASAINFALRHRRSLLCPECLTELYRGGAIYNAEMRRLAAIERVLDGGPVYTAHETKFMCDMILADLEAEFGEVIEEFRAETLWVDPGWLDKPKRPPRPEPSEEAREYQNVRKRDKGRLEKAKRGDVKRKKKRKAPGVVRPSRISKEEKELNWRAIMAGADINPNRDPIADELKRLPKEKTPLWERALRKKRNE